MQVKRQLKSAQEHGLENKDAIHTDSKRINTAKECWEHLSKLFTSSNWSEDHANKKVGQYIALWRDHKDMDRPRSVIEHARCEGIHAARSFLVTAASGVGVLLMRPWDCWCMACLAIEGRGVGNMSGKDGHSQLRVEGCTSACRGLANMFDERTVAPLHPGVSEAERKAAERHGRELVKKVRVGAYVGIQNRAGDEDDVFWVAKVVESGSGNSKHPHIFEEVSERADVQGKQIRLGSSVVGVNRGECAFTVQYLERDSSDPNRMTFMPAGGPVSLVNCSELRAINLTMRQAKVVGQVPARKPKAAKKGPKPVTTDRLVLDGESENAVLKCCY